MNAQTIHRVCASARSALTIVPERLRPELEAQLARVERTMNSQDDWKKQAAEAFEADMQPVCNAIVGALHAGDLHALQGLRALLPHLLEEVNQDPALADLLAHQLGKSLLEGLKAAPEETLL